MSTKPLSSRYDPQRIEKKIYDFWLERGDFHSQPDEAQRPFTIVIPPFNVTAELHVGHGLNLTLQDVLIRWRRMQGYNALWVPGTDHAGIATQNVVERHLAQEGKSRDDLGREAFVERVWQWKEEYRNRIVQQIQRMGASCDWERERFTMDEGLSKAVREAFVQLYEKGLLYRGNYIINWCPRCQTALSDDEVEHEEGPGFLWYIKYAIKDEGGSITVATTRPETMLGDVAVALNPQDPRAHSFVGKTLILPVMMREIPVIADDYVDPNFGTGFLKVTPAHDPNDYEVGKRHNLQPIQVINTDGTMNERCGKYAGLDRFECREKLLAELKEKGLLEKVEPYRLALGKCYRCQTIIEPYLSLQWFVKMKPLADKAIKATEEGKVVFHPARWRKVYLSWLENVRDWCISRQIWWGHRIPAWYCKSCGEITVSREEPVSCSHCQSKEIRQETDVLDTWFSSALWPFSTLGWPEKTPELSYYYPTDVLVTARDIIYFWVARMVMMGLTEMGEVPFSDVFVHAFILDEQGRKMSKSLGNFVDPMEMVAEFGADAVRITLILLTAEVQDVRFSTRKFEMGRNFANKVWNATRFLLMNIGEADLSRAREENLSFEDRWILSRLGRTTSEVTSALEKFQFNAAASRIYEFVWHEFCDWYLEAIKPVLLGQRGDEPQHLATLATSTLVLDHILRLLHPFMPFITEALWQRLNEALPQGRGFGSCPEPPSESLIRAEWPEAEPGRRGQKIETSMQTLIEVVRAIRNIRAETNIPPRAEIKVIISAPEAKMRETLQKRREFILDMSGAAEVLIEEITTRPEDSAHAVVGQIEIFVPLGTLIDIAEERKRLKRRLGKLSQELATVEAKLSNENFLARAPAQVVQSQTQRRDALSFEVEKLTASLEALGD